MPRATLPLIVALLGILGAAGLALTTYTQPIDGAASDPDLYNLLASSVGEPPLPAHPVAGQSPLPIERLAGQETAGRAVHPSGRGPATSQPTTWAAGAAALDSVAMREWLGSWVLATREVKSPDTLLLTLHRVSFHRGCPLLSTLTASYVAPFGREPRLAELRATCPRAPAQ